MSKISYFFTTREYTTFFPKPAEPINFDSKHIHLQSVCNSDEWFLLIKIMTAQNASHPDYSNIRATCFDS